MCAAHAEWEDDSWDEEDDEREDWWDEEADDLAPPALSRTLKLGFVSMGPLFLAYELALGAADGSGGRSVAELVLSAPFDPLGESAAMAARRWALVGSFSLALVLSLRHTAAESVALLPRLCRVVMEGALGALALGPLLALASRYAEPFVGPMPSGDIIGTPGLARAAIAMGGAAYEEIVFRIGVLALGYVGARQVLRWLGLRERAAAVCGAGIAALLSAAAFAASYLAVATGWLGSGGEAFELSAFTWRCAAGLLLAGLMCWRGVGVAAWAHAFYNLSRLIGIGDPT